MVSILDVDCYELNTGCFAVYGFEYKPGFVDDDAVRTFFPCLNASESPADDSLLLAQYITWVNNNKSAWTMNAGGTAADDKVNIGPRPVPQEPMVRPSSLASHYASL